MAIEIARSATSASLDTAASVRLAGRGHAVAAGPLTRLAA